LLPFVRLVHRYFGAIRLLRDVHARLVAQRLRGPVSILVGPRRPADHSRFIATSDTPIYASTSTSRC
jgi:hypothetical protein